MSENIEDVTLLLGLIGIEKAMLSIAKMAEQTAIQFKELDGEQALKVFAVAIRQANSKMWPATGAKQ